MRVRLLGPVDVVVGGAPRVVAGLRRKATLAILGLNRGVVVSAERLIDLVWDEHAPTTVANTLQSNISRLRTVLGDRAAIVARPPGYLLPAGGEPTDAEQAEDLIAQAGASADQRDRVRKLSAALELWRGPSLDDVRELPGLQPQAQRLDNLRRQATHALVDARLALGEHTALLPELERLAGEHPSDEQTHAQLILALYRAGRQAEALGVFRRVRAALRDTLGIDPGPELRDLEAAVLRQDAVLTVVPPVAPPVAVPDGLPRVPAELPPSVAGFAGRAAQLAALDDALSAAAAPGAGAIVVAVAGGAGVGKTSLAVAWAHRVAGRFPDGQLHVNLRGFDPSGSTMDPAEAVRRFLGAFQVPVTRLPVGLDAQLALYRSLLAGKRVLILLDNARDADQVRPLLPGAPGCLVVVTSRNRLAPLVAVEGARPLGVGLLDDAEAHELLGRRLGAARVAAEPAAVRDIVARCARLPLALAVAAARAALRPAFPLSALAEQLVGAPAALDALTAGDAGSDVRRVFSWSYAALTPAAARLFRLLGLHPGPDIGTSGLASLAGLPASRAAELADELTEASLVTEHAPGRYALHDLLRAHAREEAERHEDEDGRRAARQRAYDHYLYGAQVAVRTLHGAWCDLELPPPAPGATPDEPTDVVAASAYFDAEHEVLLAAVPAAAEAGFATHAWQLAWTLTLILDTRGYWHEYVEVQRAALDAVLDTGDLVGQAHAHHGVGRAYSCLGREDVALRHLNAALDGYAAVGDEAGQANIHLGFSFLAEEKGDNAGSLHESRAALRLFRSAGHRSGEAVALSNIGFSLTQLGDYAAALVASEQGLALHQQLGDPRGLAASWHSIGLVRQHLGQHREAIAGYAAGLDLARQVDDTHSQAGMLHRMGDVYQATGQDRRAREAWAEAAALFDRLGHPDAEEVRYKLRHAVG